MPNDINLNDEPPEEEEEFTKSLENALEPDELSSPPSRERVAASPEKQETAVQLFQRVRLDHCQ